LSLANAASPQGYPDGAGFGSDQATPFEDSVTGVNMYPLAPHTLPLDWETITNVDVENYLYTVGDRWSWYGGSIDGSTTSTVSTASAAYRFQGICDPSVTTTTDKKYYAGCSSANNDVDTGGVVAPTSMSSIIYGYSKQIYPLLKPLYV